jgi:glycosyltransferase involved in cell wall biosynthesis
VADGQTGFLVPRGDHRTMAGAIHYLLEHSEKRQEMSQQAVRIARQYFGSMRMVDEYLSLYQKILQTPSY